MARAMASHADVQAAAYLPTFYGGPPSFIGIRLEGFGPSVAARAAMLIALAGPDCPLVVAPDHAANNFWASIRDLTPLAGRGMLWRVNVPPSRGCAVAAAVEPFAADWLFDWAGGLVWIGHDGDPHVIRDAAAAAGGHATLVRRASYLAADVPIFHPPAPGVAALEARVRRAFDPSGVFETGRFPEAVHAD
jgi:glycolate oxidase FAD binding subunit